MPDNINITDVNGKKIVEINTIEFSSKRKIDWEGVERYLKQYVGNRYIIEETGDTVYIGSDFPDEYANSKDSIRSLGAIGKAKANAVQAIPELIRSLSEIKHFPNFDDKHSSDAPNGWYRGTVHFSIPTTDDKGQVVGRNTFRGRMVIRCGKGNTLFLYDIVTIKKKKESVK